MLTSMKMRSFCGEVFKAGGRLVYRNYLGQEINGVIVGFHETADKRQLIVVKRDCWPTPEYVNPELYRFVTYIPKGVSR